MKKLFLSLLVLAAGIAFAATATVTERLVSIKADTLAGKAQAYYQRTAVVDGVTYVDHLPVVTWDLGSTAAITITLQNGTTATTTRAHLMTAVAAVAAEVKAAQP